MSYSLSSSSDEPRKRRVGGSWSGSEKSLSTDDSGEEIPENPFGELNYFSEKYLLLLTYITRKK
jgi:hypothetical protein